MNKVLIKLFQKFAGSRGSAPCRAPQSTEPSYLRSKALKIGVWGKENKSFPSPIYLSHIHLFQYLYFEKKDFTDRLKRRLRYVSQAALCILFQVVSPMLSSFFSIRSVTSRKYASSASESVLSSIPSILSFHSAS